ncbi:unnamed protein product [Protopolystoma xenopodis]|uniref:Uncharacterized protein n=1 Tax=Protopolystoma xenopodis TaxID=117903 RepID=A0A3S5BDL3_9PLAT|nr:unnamed protein product [Protopolystoma xenopodis]
MPCLLLQFYTFTCRKTVSVSIALPRSLLTRLPAFIAGPQLQPFVLSFRRRREHANGNRVAYADCCCLYELIKGLLCVDDHWRVGEGKILAKWNPERMWPWFLVQILLRLRRRRRQWRYSRHQCASDLHCICHVESVNP